MLLTGRALLTAALLLAVAVSLSAQQQRQRQQRRQAAAGGAEGRPSRHSRLLFTPSSLQPSSPQPSSLQPSSPQPSRHRAQRRDKALLGAGRPVTPGVRDFFSAEDTPRPRQTAARSSGTRSRVDQYLHALQQKFGVTHARRASQQPERRGQGRSRPVDMPAIGSDPGQDDVQEAGTDREDRGILFFPGNVRHSFGIPASIDGSVVRVAHPVSGVATRLNGGAVSTPIRSLLDTTGSTVTVTQGQVGGARPQAPRRTGPGPQQKGFPEDRMGQADSTAAAAGGSRQPAGFKPRRRHVTGQKTRHRPGHKSSQGSGHGGGQGIPEFTRLGAATSAGKRRQTAILFPGPTSRGSRRRPSSRARPFAKRPARPKTTTLAAKKSAADSDKSNVLSFGPVRPTPIAVRPGRLSAGPQTRQQLSAAGVPRGPGQPLRQPPAGPSRSRSPLTTPQRASSRPAQPTSQLQDFDRPAQRLPLFIARRDFGRHTPGVARVCRQDRQCSVGADRCRSGRDCAAGVQCCYSRCLGTGVCQRLDTPDDQLIAASHFHREARG